MTIENELDAYISGFHLDALSSGVPLNVDLDTTLTVVAGNLYRLFARDLTRYQPPPRHHLAPLPEQPGTLHFSDRGVTCALTLRRPPPQLIDASYCQPRNPIPIVNKLFPPPIHFPPDNRPSHANNLNSISAPEMR